ncbi:HD domain-containing protein [Desulfitobacterium sp. PCE1]|uniref:HD domain-containing protein n=1 Tax=Desulfitobacterium sp. PCE1 TaxID=146907 RepID=UPI00210F4031|nr:HD domain-containing protein [Desulfitobacterium sp. PCE1]
MRSIIDTACFQRLRNIRQTSYAPLYPASFHNRFIHSIGVYHLGRKVFNTVRNSVDCLEQMSNEEMDNIKRIFELACLLHDVGHAPFSHTGERFFLEDAANSPAIYASLRELVSDDEFSNDFDYYYNNAKVAAPHEIMSCIVALNVFKGHFKEASERAFFCDV